MAPLLHKAAIISFILRNVLWPECSGPVTAGPPGGDAAPAVHQFVTRLESTTVTVERSHAVGASGNDF